LKEKDREKEYARLVGEHEKARKEATLKQFDRVEMAERVQALLEVICKEEELTDEDYTVIMNYVQPLMPTVEHLAVIEQAGALFGERLGLFSLEEMREKIGAGEEPEEFIGFTGRCMAFVAVGALVGQWQGVENLIRWAVGILEESGKSGLEAALKGHLN